MLNDLACKSLIAKAKKLNKRIKKADSKGLLLIGLPNGSGSWRYKYRINRKENSISFGPYPQVSLAAAREEHSEAYKLVLKGIDPADVRKEKAKQAKLNAENSFEVIGRKWHDHNLALWSPDHARTVMLRLEKDLFKSIGYIPVPELTRRQLLDALQMIEQRESHEVARRSLQFAKRILNYACDLELITVNVAIGLEGSLKPTTRGHFPSMDIDHLPEFLKALDRNEARLTTDTRDAMESLMLTLVRIKELIAWEWTEINFDKALWTIPAHRMKMRREHLVPLSRQVLKILERRKHLNDLQECPSKYVFPGQYDGNKHMCERTVGKALFAMKYRDIHTGHGFRALGMGIAMERLNYAFEVPDRQLGHVPENEVRRSYDRALFLKERTKMMQELADYVDMQRKPKEVKRNNLPVQSFGYTTTLSLNPSPYISPVVAYSA